MNSYDISVVGGGPAGMMAAIRAGGMGSGAVILERNAVLGRKLLITGKGRCNITNTAPIEVFIDRFGRQGLFLRTAFRGFSNDDLSGFFHSLGLGLREERPGRVFPETDSSRSVLDALKEALTRNGADIMYDSRVTGIVKEKDAFRLGLARDKALMARKVVLATGGASYRITGSSGDGYDIAGRLGHTVTPLMPGLVPLRTKEKWVGSVKGLTLTNVRLTFKSGKSKIVSEIGECLFTHFGVSGPLVLDLSGHIVSMLEKSGSVRLFIDLKPGLSEEKLELRLRRDLEAGRKAHIDNVMKGLLPKNIIKIALGQAGVDPGREANQVRQAERRAVAKAVKALALTITGSLPIEEAMVTMGGVSTDEIDPKTMGSRLVPGLYFAGEIIDGGAPSGGYNLQQAFSTGRLAGESAARWLMKDSCVT